MTSKKIAGLVYREGMRSEEYPIETLRALAYWADWQPEDYWTGVGIEGTPIPTLTEMIELHEAYIAGCAYIVLSRLEDLHPDLWPTRLRKLSPVISRMDPEIRDLWREYLPQVKKALATMRTADRIIAMVEESRTDRVMTDPEA